MSIAHGFGFQVASLEGQLQHGSGPVVLGDWTNVWWTDARCFSGLAPEHGAPEPLPVPYLIGRTGPKLPARTEQQAGMARVAPCLSPSRIRRAPRRAQGRVSLLSLHASSAPSNAKYECLDQAHALSAHSRSETRLTTTELACIPYCVSPFHCRPESAQVPNERMSWSMLATAAP